MTMPVRKYLMNYEVDSLIVHDFGNTDNLLIQMGIITGCRVSEIINILVRNIKGQVIKIWDEKKDEYRDIVIDAHTAKWIGYYLDHHYKPLRGVRKRDRKLFNFSYKTANRKVKKAFAAVGISDDVPHRWHTLRHTHIRLTLDRMGARGIQYACEQTGDSPQTILGIYGVPSVDERMKEIENMFDS